MLNKKKFTAVFLTVTMLLCCLPIAGISARADVTWNNAATGQWATLTADSTILKETNLLAGITAKNGSTGTDIALNSSSAAISVSTDGKLAKGNDNTTYTSYKIGRGAAWRRMTYNMGGLYSVQDFVVAACADGSKYAPHLLRIYVSSALESLYDATSLVIKAEKFDTAGYQWQFKAAEAVVGQYVGFELYSPPWLASGTTVNQTDNPECYDTAGNLIYTEWWDLLRLAEIGAYGEKYTAPVGPVWKDAEVGQWTLLTDDSDILKETNRLDGVPATNGSMGTAYELGSASANISVSTDGKLAVSGDDTTVISYKIKRGPAWRQMTYDMAGKYSVQDFVVAACADGSKYAPHHIRIYVSETEETLYDAANLVVKAEKFNTSGYQWHFKAAEAVVGRYVGFEVYSPPWLAADTTVNQADNPECYDTAGNLIYTEWWDLIRLGEIGAYGTFIEALPERNYTTVVVDDAADFPTGNLLKGEAIQNKTDIAGNPIDYLQPTDNGGGALTTAGESTIASMTDGLICGVNTNAAQNGAGLNKVTGGGFMYDLRGKVEIEKILISSTTDSDPNYRITYLEVYAADTISDLFAGEPIVDIDLRMHPNLLVTLKEKVTARYVGFKAPRIGIYDVVHIGELGVYGTYKSTPRPFDDNLLLGRLPVDNFLSFKDNAANRMKNTFVQIRNIEEYGNTFATMTDGDTTNRSSLYTMAGADAVEGWEYMDANGGDGRKLEPNTPWIVLVYHLGGTVKINEMSLISSNEPGVFVAGVEFYASDKIATLFDKENLLKDTKGGTTYIDDRNIELLDPNYDVLNRTINVDLFDEGGKEARYVAFVITRAHPVNAWGYSMARVSELVVNGEFLSPDPVFDTNLQTVTDAKTGISVTIDRQNLDDVDFFDGLQLDVTTSKLPTDIPVNFDDNWLHVESEVYTLTLKDKNGRAYTADEVGDRIWSIRIPKTGDGFQMAATLQNGQLVRVRSSYSDPTEQFVKIGTPHGNDSTIRGNSLQYVLVRYNTLDELNTINNVVLNAPAEYTTEGVSDHRTPLWLWSVGAVIGLIAVTAVVYFIWLRRVRQ